MNIFFLHQNPHQAAKYQYNKHIVKMVLDECSIQAYWNYYIDGKKNIANPKTETLYEERPKTTYKAI